MGSLGDDASVLSDNTQGSRRFPEEKIFVSVRLRPLNDREIAKNDSCYWECINNNTVVYKKSLQERSLVPTAYAFDRVFGPECSTRKVYEDAAKEIALSVVTGINSSVFAYGQTSSGKTYTMNGITHSAIMDIYDYVEKHNDREFVLKFSAMEIYNEAIRDLLNSDTTPLRLLDDPEKGTIVERLTEETLRDHSHLEELIAVCEAQRQVGETSLNETSSRSHQILRLIIESSARDYLGPGSASTLSAYVDFVDLAGSERASQASSAGMRLKEGFHINRSLLTLGTIIRKLSKGENAHIPYRDSKLTRILQNSLGGNAKTAIICTMSPAHSHVDQSRNTLHFASCAKEVTTNAQVNIVISDKALVKKLQKELGRMETELRSLEKVSARRDFSALLKEKEQLIEKMEEEIKVLAQQRDLAQCRVEDLLRAAREDGASRLDKLLASELSHRAKSPSRQNTLQDFDEHQLQISDAIEDDYLLDDNTPRFYGPDPCQGWEDNAQRYSQGLEVKWKEVRCIEEEESRLDKKIHHANITDNASVPNPKENEGKSITNSFNSVGDVNLSHTHEECIHLKQKVQQLQRTIKYLIKHYPMKQSLSFFEAVKFGYKGLRLTRSVSGRPTLTIPSCCEQETVTSESLQLCKSKSGRSVLTIPSSWVEKEDENERTQPNEDEEDLHGNSWVDREVENEKTELDGHEKGLPCDSWVEKTGQSKNSKPTENEKDLPGDSWVEKEIECEKTQPNAKEKEFPNNSGLEKEVVNRKAEVSKHEKDSPSSNSGKLSRNNSQSFVSSDMTDSEMRIVDYDDDDDKTTVLNYSIRTNQIGKRLYEKHFSDDSYIAEQLMPDVLKPQSNWVLEFEKQQRQIIELWDACHVALVHRSCFILLFKGDPSDSVYIEVEHRRLSFLKCMLSQRTNATRDSQSLALASSVRALAREREMISKQIHKLYPRKEKEALYEKWGIDLETKQRSRQVAKLVWRDTRDMHHIKESAKLVAELIGFHEQDQAPKEIFGLSFSLETINGRSKSIMGSSSGPKSTVSFKWKSNMSAIS